MFSPVRPNHELDISSHCKMKKNLNLHMKNFINSETHILVKFVLWIINTSTKRSLNTVDNMWYVQYFK